jgi:hypothetical protein
MAEAVAAPPRAGRCGRNISSGATEVAGPCHWTCRQIVAVAPLDTTLIPPRTQYGATRSKREVGQSSRASLYRNRTATRLAQGLIRVAF